MATPETAIKKQIRDYLKLDGWFVRHHLAGLGSYPGMPDMSATKNSVTIEIEVKTPKGVQSQKQMDYEIDLVDHGGHYVLARNYEEVEKYLNIYLPHEENNL